MWTVIGFVIVGFVLTLVIVGVVYNADWASRAHYTCVANEQRLKGTIKGCVGGRPAF